MGSGVSKEDLDRALDDQNRKHEKRMEEMERIRREERQEARRDLLDAYEKKAKAEAASQKAEYQRTVYKLAIKSLYLCLPNKQAFFNPFAEKTVNSPSLFLSTFSTSYFSDKT